MGLDFFISTPLGIFISVVWVIAVILCFVVGFAGLITSSTRIQRQKLAVDVTRILIGIPFIWGSVVVTQALLGTDYNIIGGFIGAAVYIVLFQLIKSVIQNHTEAVVKQRELEKCIKREYPYIQSNPDK